MFLMRMINAYDAIPKEYRSILHVGDLASQSQPASPDCHIHRRSVRLLGENLFESLKGWHIGSAYGCTQQACYIQYVTFAQHLQGFFY
jgi:hypothetical protein